MPPAPALLSGIPEATGRGQARLPRAAAQLRSPPTDGPIDPATTPDASCQVAPAWPPRSGAETAIPAAPCPRQLTDIIECYDPPINPGGSL